MRIKETDTDKIGKHLRGTIYARCRKRAGFVKQQDAVKALGFKTPYQLSVYETGKADPPINVLYRMSNVYKMSIDDLLGNVAFRRKEDIGPMTEQELIEGIEKLILQYKNNIKDKRVKKSKKK